MAGFLQNVGERLFGWAFPQPEKPEPVGLQPRDADDGSVTTIAAPVAGTLGTITDFDNYSIRNDFELITRYREMSFHPEIDAAVDEITCEAVTSQGDSPDTVKIVLDDIKALGPDTRNAIAVAFEEVKELLDLRHNCYSLFRSWYIDGRIYFQVMIDEKNPQLGIQEIRLIDAKKIRKVREYEKIRVDAGTGGGGGVGTAVLTRVKNEYFMYMETGFQAPAMGSDQPAYGPTSGLKVAKDSIIYVTSGITDSGRYRVLGFLHLAIKYLNQLRVLEDAAVIFRMSRAPERRVWRIEVGNLPKMKAEQYLRDIMTKHKNRLNYDQSTGEVHDQRKFQTILEDYWLPTRGGVGTQVSVLPPGVGLGTADIEYFLKRLYASLKIPVGRLDPDQQLAFSGAATSISRDEVKFGQFISRLRLQFCKIFLDALGKQLVLKNILDMDTWKKIRPYIRFDWAKNNYFMEIKDQQILQARLDLAMNIQQFVGLYFSHDWVKKNILKQTETEIEEMSMEIMQEGPPVVYTDQGLAADPGAANGQAGPPQEGRSGKSMAMGGASPRNPAEMQALYNGGKGTDFRSVANILKKGT